MSLKKHKKREREKKNRSILNQNLIRLLSYNWQETIEVSYMISKVTKNIEEEEEKKKFFSDYLEKI